MNELPNTAKVVVIGGGVVGTSTAYHLAKFGWKNTILLERDQLTSGTTWHAAGLVSQLGPSAAITKIRKYSLELYKELEKEIDFSSGLKLNGALSIATTEGRWQELQRQATTAQLYDVNVKVLNINEVEKTYPIIDKKLNDLVSKAVILLVDNDQIINYFNERNCNSFEILRKPFRVDELFLKIRTLITNPAQSDESLIIMQTNYFYPKG